MKTIFRASVIYLIVSLTLSVICFYVGAMFVDDIGGGLLVILLSPIVGFMVGIPTTFLLYRFVQTRYNQHDHTNTLDTA